jgi:hypothetical protein
MKKEAATKVIVVGLKTFSSFTAKKKKSPERLCRVISG